MNFDPPATPRPRQQPTQQPAGEGSDPAALVAARTAAVARNRQKAARDALIHDILRVVGVAVLVGGVAWIVHVKYRHHVEDEDRRAEQAREERSARAKEREEAEARAEVRRAAAQAAAAEKSRQEEEKRQELERQKAEKSQIEANKKRYKAALERFHGTTLDLLSAAPATDNPEKVTGETWYSCVMPVGPKGMTLYEMKALPGKDILVTRLDAEGVVTNVPYDAFSSLAAKNPFLLAKGAYCYYRGAKKWEMRVPVPAAQESIDPARGDFRDLYEFAARQCGKAPAVAYEVFFLDAGLETRVHVVPFGATFGRADVAKGLQQLLGPGAARGRAGGANDIQARLDKGGLVIRRKGKSR